MASIQDSFINLRNDFKTWGTNNLRLKANKSSLTASDGNVFSFDVNNTGEYGFYTPNKFIPIGRRRVVGISIVEYFVCTDTIQEFEVPLDGAYRLEVYGGQGGGIRYADNGGNGGYSRGDIQLTKGQKLYIVVGGRGTNAESAYIDTPGGYNGGGKGHSTKSSSGRWHLGGGGGGATHIATASGLLSELSSNKGSVLIVAGGGGGAGGKDGWKDDGSSASTSVSGGTGGGTAGGAGIGDSGRRGEGGTQTAGGAANVGVASSAGTFGKGGCGDSTNTQFSGGGGGYYGGGAGFYESSAGGGSGYIGGVVNGVTENGVRKGEGFAQITYIGEEIEVPEVPDTPAHVHIASCYRTYAKESIRHTSSTYGNCSGCGASYENHYYTCNICGGDAGWARTSNCTCGKTPSSNNSNHTHTVTEKICGYD